MDKIRDRNPAATGGLTRPGEKRYPNGGGISLPPPAKSFYFVWPPCTAESDRGQAKLDLGFSSRFARTRGAI